MFALKAAALIYLGHLALAVRRIVQPIESSVSRAASSTGQEAGSKDGGSQAVGSKDGGSQPGPSHGGSLEEILEDDWEAWAWKEVARLNGDKVEEYDNVSGASMLDVNVSSRNTPCVGYTPCKHGLRGWTHQCLEQIDRGVKSEWDRVFQELSCVPVALLAGDADGRFVTFENYGRKTHQHFPTFSGGKRPGAVAAARSVMVGNMTWDTKANEVFDWWTKDGGDPRSRVTFQSLLHFTSGFIVDADTDFDHDGEKHTCLSMKTGWMWTMEECAKQIYEVTRHVEPNTQFVYNSLHVHLAVAMAVKKSGLTARQYLQENLYDPANMHHSYYGGKDNPFIAASMITTGEDYANFLHSVMAYKIINKETADVMEAEYRNAHGIPDVGRIVRWDDFCMAQAHLAGFPECLNMGGSQVNCINRAGGTWWTLLPNPREYIGRANGMVSAEVINHGKEWIHDDLRIALRDAHAR